jgi:hypothetical protein
MTTKIVLGIALAWMAAASFLFAMSSPSSSPGLQNLRHHSGSADTAGPASDLTS